MKASHKPRFDIEAVRELAGAKVFARGEAYHRDGQVVLLGIEPERVLAQVAGTEDYRTELTGRGTNIDGDCSCPAFEDWGYCKHMVAVALAVNAAGDDMDGTGAISRIRDHLKARGVDSLVEMILGLAERDPALFRRLDMAATAERGDDKTVEARLRRSIDSATRAASYVEYREVRTWAAGVDEALDAIAELVPAGRASLALKLAEQALDRIEHAIESIDDSDGYCGELLNRACEIHLAAAVVVRPDPVRFARDLFARQAESGYGTFDGAARLYADVLGEKGLGEYRRLASDAWDKLPSRQGPARGQFEYSSGYYRLQDILDFFAERDGDVDARIALRTKDLSSPGAYLQLAEFCLTQGREEEALRRAEEGLWVFEDGRPHERLLLFVAALLPKAGRGADAESLLWRAFEKVPSDALYAGLRALGGEAARDRALTLLESRLAKTEPTRWHHPADFLIAILMREQMQDAAWVAVRKYGASLGVRESLARMSEAAFPGEAREVYAERVEALVLNGGNPGYAEAAKLIAHLAGLMDRAAHEAYVAAVKERHRRKRNLMKLLE